MSDMYLPKVFAVEDLARLHDFMEQFNFATLVTQHNGQISASHIPFLLDRNTGAFGALRAHIAIRNPQLRDLQSGSPALVIFQGPHTYISPSWYVNSGNVPTWNYTAVHAQGVPKIGNKAAMLALLQDLTAKQEGVLEKPWKFVPEAPWVQPLLNEIVAFEMRIEKLEGKFKLNQNRKPEDRAKVIETLSASEDPAHLAVAEWMGRT